MGSIRFINVTHKDKDGLPQLFELGPSACGRAPLNLLDEAVRFYNYPATGNYTAVTDWATFSEKRINEAIPALHNVFKENIVRMVRQLYQTIPDHIDKKNCRNFHGWHSELGVMCAKLLVSDECRSNKKVEQLRKKANNVHFREFEKLIPALDLLKIWVKRVENIYQERYATLIGGPEIKQALFEPAWGGSWLVEPNKELWESGDKIWNPEEPVYPYGRHKVGPTEKLYFALTSDIFIKLHNVPFHHSKGHLSRTKDVFLQRVYGQARIISQIIPSFNSGDKRIISWSKWQRNLEHLAYLFENALEVKTSEGKPPMVWLEIKNEEYVSWIKVDDCGVRVGFPAALGLIGTLYAYITDIMAQTLMSALSGAIIDIYEETNGYTAMGLYEALSLKNIVATVGGETVLDKKLVGILRQWQTVPVGDVQDIKNPWGDAEVDTWSRKCFKQLLARPLISEDRWEHTESYKKQINDSDQEVSFDDFFRSYIPRFPVITKQFYENLPLPKEQIHKKNGFNIDNWYADEKLYGATFESQVHIFVAFQLLERSKEILKWNWADKEYRFKEGNYKTDKKALKKKRHPCFFITAGSLVFGGKKPPHITHRHGVNFDFILGPDLISWPVTKISDYIVDFKKNKSCHEWLKKFSETNKRKEFLIKTRRPRAHVICYTKEQENKKVAQMVRRPHMVFRPIVRDEMVNLLTREIRKYCTRKNNSNLFYSEKEKDKYAEVEKKLEGTPHFNSDIGAESLKLRPEERTELADWQRTHAGHLSIVLSAPKMIVYGSPIVHFRALHAIRQALKAEGLFVCDFECSEEYINYLNTPEEYEYKPPEGLFEIFLSNGIPLAPDHKIVTKSSGEWILTNYEREFRLNEQDNAIRVSFLIANDLVTRFSSLINFTNFSFMPDNHHSHWHVDYSSNKLDVFRSLWMSMGVDLRGFKEYLSMYKTNKQQALKPVTAEQQEIRTWCGNYVEEFDLKYGKKEIADNDRQFQNRTISKGLMEAIFGVYKDSDSSFIKPAVIFEKISGSNQSNVQAQTAEELKGQIKFSEKLLFGRAGLVEQFYIRKTIGKEQLNFVNWMVGFVREQEPFDIGGLIEKKYDEPELEDYETTNGEIV